jgi:osmoprotectant transport system permease protein
VGLIGDAIAYVRDNPDRFLDELWVHVWLSASALAIAVALFVPLGVLASRSRRVGPAIVGAVAAARVVPSLAVLFLLVPTMGLGNDPALVALTLVAGPPLVINTDAGLRHVDAAVLENARGLGMNLAQLFARVQFPLALPVIIAGVRSAAVDIVASATLAALIGAGGLGNFITSGLTLLEFHLLLVGAIPVTLLVLLVEVGLGGLERLVSPPVAR